jgi:2-polyprenyl-6-methoxyphenol hydroxylase-like FAD-dependent oxidoreductase
MTADVLIAGGGIAGASLAVLLGRRGLRVELYEQRQFPSEKPCGEGIMPAGVGALARLGLLDAVGGVPLAGVRYHAADVDAEARFPQVEGVPSHGLGQRRLRLDAALFAAARATSGVHAVAGARVDGAIVERGRVTGIVVAGRERRAPLVVIADGAQSRIRRRLGLDGAPPRRPRVGVRAHFRLAREAPRWVDVYLGDGHELYTTPLPEGEMLVAALADRRALGGDAKSAFRRWIAEQPALRARLEGAAEVSAIEGRAPLAGRPRAGVVPGAVLLGDAAGWTDPVTGGGMAQALLAAELLADYAPRAIAEGDTWLHRFDREREALLRDYRLLTQLVLQLVQSPWLARQSVRAFRAHPPLMEHLVAVAGGAKGLFFTTRTRGARPSPSP